MVYCFLQHESRNQNLRACTSMVGFVACLLHCGLLQGTTLGHPSSYLGAPPPHILRPPTLVEGWRNAALSRRAAVSLAAAVLPASAAQMASAATVASGTDLLVYKVRKLSVKASQLRAAVRSGGASTAARVTREKASVLLPLQEAMAAAAPGLTLLPPEDLAQASLQPLVLKGHYLELDAALAKEEFGRVERELEEVRRPTPPAARPRPAWVRATVILL